jgi:hypothetical protein
MGRRGAGAVVALVAVASASVTASVLVAPPAGAIPLDGPTRQCLEARIGAAATQRIAKAQRLTAAQRRHVTACRSGGPSTASVVVWTSDGNGGWTASGKAPSCAAVEWSLPVDSLAGVQTVLDPGQVRGGRYKAHGGFRMADSATLVRSPVDGYIVSAAAYRETATGQSGAGGEVQYLVDIQNPCGLAVRFDHLKTLEPTISRALANVPVRDDSRTTPITAPVSVTRGQVLATVVGHTETGVNPSFDFGAYDYRARQDNRRSEAELRAFGPDGLQGLHALCWLDLFGSGPAAALRAIPRTSTEGAQGSDVCR